MLKSFLNLLQGKKQPEINGEETEKFEWNVNLFKPFIDEISKPLSSTDKEIVWNCFSEECSQADQFYDALHEACLSLDMKKSWIFMQVDWKATDEVEWQANIIAKTHGLTDTFSLDENFEEHGLVDDALILFDEWLIERNYKFISYNPGHDAYYGFVCKQEDVETMMNFATSHEIELSM